MVRWRNGRLARAAIETSTGVVFHEAYYNTEGQEFTAIDGELAGSAAPSQASRSATSHLRRPAHLQPSIFCVLCGLLGGSAMSRCRVTTRKPSGLQLRPAAFGTRSSEVWGERRAADIEVGTFATQAAFDAEIPIVESPLSGDTLAQLAMMAQHLSLTASPPEVAGRIITYGSGVIFTAKVLLVYTAGGVGWLFRRPALYYVHRATRTPLPPDFGDEIPPPIGGKRKKIDPPN
jgi:hypothetical protein